jgi:nitrite reductase/ring-hydroxylating ferredoxin subunit/uncharacterized membrane protein
VSLHAAAERVGRIEVLDRVAAPLAAAVKRAVPHGPLKDLLSGTWLGHPLHPLLTDIPIGSLTSATVLDLIGGKRARPAADRLVALGLAAAIPTAAAGAADWSDTAGAEQRAGVVHALSNVAGLAFYGASLVARRRGRRGRATVLGLAGMSAMSVGGYLGGYLSYSRGVGINNAFFHQHADDWTSVLTEAEMPEGKPLRVETDGATVVLYRANGSLSAIDSRCSHAGGPLEDGAVEEAACTIECPWHQSVFRLSDGSVVHGPASVPQAAYEVRVQDGRVQIRHRR